MAEKLKKGREALAKEGTFEASYGAEWFVKIKDALAIAKVVFSFVNKSNAKEEHFDIYLDVNEFLSLCNDFENHTAMRILAQEKANGEKYPKFYRFNLGENGGKSLGLSASDAPGAVVLHGEVPGANGKGKIRKAIKVENATAFFASARFWTEVAYGLKQVAPGSILENIRSLYWEAEKERASYMATVEEAEVTEYVPVEEAPAAEVRPEKPVTEKKPEKPEKPAEAKSKEKGTSEKQIRLFMTEGPFFEVNTAAEKAKPVEDRTMKIKVRDVNGSVISSALSEVIFYKTQRNNARDFYDRLVEAADNRNGIKLKLVVKPCGERNGISQYVFQSNAS